MIKEFIETLQFMIDNSIFFDFNVNFYLIIWKFEVNIFRLLI